MRFSSRRGFLGTLGTLTAAGSVAAPASAEAFTMRLGLGGPAGSVFDAAGQRFAQSVARRSNGQLKIEVYPVGQLAPLAEAIEGVRTGVIDFSIQATAYLVRLVPEFQVFDMPFMFRDATSGYRVLDGPIGKELFAALEPKGIIGLGWGASGFKQLETTSKPVTVPDDMKGLRIRIQSGAVYVAMYQAVGAIPVVIDVSEAFVALNQRVVDGCDLNIDFIASGKYYTVVKHVAMFNHVFSVIPLMMSKRKYDTLPPNLQKIVKEEAPAVLPYWRALTARQTTDDIVILKQNGVSFTDIQYAPFRKAMDPVYVMMQQKIGGDLLERVSRAAAS